MGAKGRMLRGGVLRGSAKWCVIGVCSEREMNPEV